MDMFILTMLVAAAAYILKSKDERKRITLLGRHLGQYQIEKLMESLTEGYLRALGEADASRREQIWQLLGSSETKLSDQFNSFVVEFAKVDALQARVSTLALGLPYARQAFPNATFDLRQALAIHAQGISRAIENSQGRPPKARAFTVSAEMLLMQHTCHWFCKSKTVASARLMLRHQTTYEQALAAVAPETRRAYQALLGG
jgi:hypothetical protein